VQGVGFRPFVYRLASEARVDGVVRNDAAGVTIEAFGPARALDGFESGLGAPPPPARVDSLVSVAVPWQPGRGFVIEDSRAGGTVSLSIPPDLPVCPSCLSELVDPADRRAGYPFINCTSCGPRFTIALDVPYDRPATTMAPFRMCERCQDEYDRPENRRFHAQPNACPTCGPRLSLEPRTAGDPIAVAAHALRDGEIVAVKGLGGFHLACDATSETAVARLRARKRRDEKPLAVMVLDLAAARRLAELSPEEEALLSSVERPITLVRRRENAPIAPGVAPASPLLGLLLAYTPLHHLLLEAAGRPLVMTSANLSDEPIARTEEDVRRDLPGVADRVLGHDREIHSRCDDSVARVIDGGPVLIRRSRGWVPRPIALPRPVPRPILACGAQLKNTFCLAQGDRAYLGQHIGDLDSAPAFAFFEEAVERMERLVQVRPEVIAHDLHPDYLSTRYAEARGGERIAVQHHHAHVASAMAEHGLEGPVLGVAYDGTGYGTDGESWGGELLVVDRSGFRRQASFRPVRLAGGDLAVRQPWRVALALLEDAFAADPPLDLPLFHAVDRGELRLVRQVLAVGLNSPPARGVGRLFDGVAALALARPRAAFEGQLAMALNLAAGDAAGPAYPFDVDEESDPWTLDPRPMIRAIVDDLRAGRGAGVAARFHATLVAATAAAVRRALAIVGRMPVLLTGGCFVNPLLAEGLRRALGDLDVRLHRAVPPGDGGISLGQAAVASWRMRCV
jgi:hydrogenase maturation protein HypF